MGERAPGTAEAPFTSVFEQNVLVNENFVRLLEVTCQERPGLDVQYGGVGGFIAKKPPKRVDPMKIIQVDEHSFKLNVLDMKPSSF